MQHPEWSPEKIGEELKQRQRHEPLLNVHWRFQFRSGTGLDVFLDAAPFDGAITNILTERPR